MPAADAGTQVGAAFFSGMLICKFFFDLVFLLLRVIVLLLTLLPVGSGVRSL